MACSKYTLTNTGTTSVNFNYRRCDNLIWEYGVNLEPNQTKTIWLIDETYSTPEIYESSVVLVNEGVFPITPTPTRTPTNTPTPTPTPTPVASILTLTFDTVENINLLVGDATSVEDWNTFFDLPTYGTPFTSVQLVESFVNPQIILVGGDNIEIKDDLFYESSSILEVDDSGSVVTLGSRCLAYTSNLTSVNFPSVTLSRFITEINYGVFEGCSGLISASLPSLLELTKYFFYDCSGLSVINLTSVTTAVSYCFYGCTSLVTADLPSLTTAGSHFFYGCTSLTTADLPSLTTMGNSFFFTCSGLLTVNLPALTTAENSSFFLCTSLTTVNLPVLTTAKIACFSQCTSLSTVSLPALTTALDSCFFQCTSLTTVSLPVLITAEDYCFSQCTSLTTISLPSCQNLGLTVGDNLVFESILGNTISLTVPSALMTCNSGNPDGDIQYLQANNTVTITTV